MTVSAGFSVSFVCVGEVQIRRGFEKVPMHNNAVNIHYMNYGGLGDGVVLEYRKI